VGGGNAIHLTLEYDIREVILILMRNFERLNLFIQAYVFGLVDGLPIEEGKINMFGVEVFMEESSRALCRDPSLGLVIKARAYEGAGQE
jgi:hypothetical protein